MSEHVIADAAEVGDGERILVQVEGRDICVFNVDDEYHAYTNWCPHQAGPVCEGPVSGTTEASYDRETYTTTKWVREGEILACPWHGWEFDLTNGHCLSHRDVAIPSHPVHVEDGKLVVTL